MSPELNGNPPVLIKRKKNRDKKHASTSKINDFTPPPYNLFQTNLNSYPSVALNEPYYAFPQNYPLPTEPMSLPIYPAYSNMHVPMNYPYNGPKFFKIPVEQTETSDYMSLPVANGEQSEDMSQRRFSDPGLPNESDSSYNSNDSQSHVIQSLTQQIGVLKENNRKLNREVTELRMELNMLKHQASMKHYEREYEPGMITDIIREIRDAARVREDALLAKVKHMVEEKQLSMGQFHLASEKNRNTERLNKLEEQMKSLNLNTSSRSCRSEDNISLPSGSLLEENGGSARQVFEMEREALLLRRELQDARARKEESDQKILQLDKRISNLLRPKTNTAASETSDDGKTSDTLSVTTQSSMVSQTPHRITLSGPVTDL